jgi:hypothetical protein
VVGKVGNTAGVEEVHLGFMVRVYVHAACTCEKLNRTLTQNAALQLNVALLAIRR